MSVVKSLVMVASLLPLTAAWLNYGAAADEVEVLRAQRAPGLPRPGAAPGDPQVAKAEDAQEETAIDLPRPASPPLAPRHMRLHLLDGSIISGDLSVSEIHLETPFGKLVVPINRIRSFTPGLDSNTNLAAELAGQIQRLGADDYKTREQAHKELAARGLVVQQELQRFADDENAEIKRHVGEILKEFEQLAEEQADDEVAAPQPWIRLDTVVTTEFTVLGKISPLAFEVASKYGPLKIELADVKRGEREQPGRETFQKSLTVDGSHLAQKAFKGSGIRVQAGDKITVRADGNIVMTPWGGQMASSPEGMPNHGWYIPNQIPSGALVARIGERGTIFKVGRQLALVAKSSGVLQFAVGMQDEYANENFSFPGQYNIKLKIDPK